MNGKTFQISFKIISSFFINIPTKVKVNRVTSNLLLAHLPQFHIGKVNRCKILQNLKKKKPNKNKKPEVNNQLFAF